MIHRNNNYYLGNFTRIRLGFSRFRKMSTHFIYSYYEYIYDANSNRIKAVSDLFFNLFTLLNNISAKLNFISFRFQCSVQSILSLFIQL